jgi:hypothetical protein
MRSKTAVRRRLMGATAINEDTGRAFPQVNPSLWACQDLNLGPHPYQVSRAKRCAQGRFPRSLVTVRGEGMRSWRPCSKRCRPTDLTYHLGHAGRKVAVPAVLSSNLLARRKRQAVHGGRSRAWRVASGAISISSARLGPRSLASARASWIRGRGVATVESRANRTRSVWPASAAVCGPTSRASSMPSSARVVEG